MGFKQKVNQRLDSIDKNLAEHMHRTDMLEDKMVTFDDLVGDAKGAIRFFKIIGGIAGFIAAVVEIVRYFH